MMFKIPYHPTADLPKVSPAGKHHGMFFNIYFGHKYSTEACELVYINSQPKQI